MANSTPTPNLQCTVDGSDAIEVFFTIEEIPIFNNVLWETPAEALNAPQGELELGYCSDCGHIYNVRFQPELMAYDVSYENSLHFSKRFQDFIEAQAADLIERYDLRGKTVIDVGCGKGDFLKLICEMGNMTGYGFDKSYEPTPQDSALENVNFIQDFFTEAYSDYRADFLVCRHVLEHIHHPTIFLQGIRQAIGTQKDTVIMFEVPNGLYTLRDMGIWDIIYEHCSYFTPNSLIHLFTESGFHVHRVEEVYGGQFLTIETTVADELVGQAIEPAISLDSLAGLVQHFSNSYKEKLQYWQEKLQDFRDEDKKTVIWGTGSKGVTFLNVLDRFTDIQYAVDINPRKQQKYVAGAGQEIVAPEFLKSYQPDVVLIMNPQYANEIETTVKNLGLNAAICIV